VVHYNTSHAEAEETAQGIHEVGGEAYLVQADLLSVDEIESAVAAMGAHWPQLDVLIHNAAVFFPTPFGETSEADWDTTLDSNLKGPYFLTQALLPMLKKSAHPSIICIGDEGSSTPAKRLIPYAISKEGLRIFAMGLKKVCPTMNIHHLNLGPTLPSEDSRLKAPRLAHSVDEAVEKVLSLIAS
jgi:pteridine reductase